MCKRGSVSGASSPATCLFSATPRRQSHPRLGAFIPAADTLIPVVGVEMQTHWLPDERDDFGKLARWYLWLRILAGRALTLLAVAGFPGLIKQDST
jgi:hypothetical protein